MIEMNAITANHGRYNMRWKTRKPEPGTTRTVAKFAWLPTQIEQYTVWLEFYSATFIFDGKEWAEIVDFDFSNNRLIFPTRRVSVYY